MSTPSSSMVIALPFALISFGRKLVCPGSVVAPFSVKIVTPDISTALWSPEATNVEDTSIRLETTELTLPAVSVCVTEMTSSPSRKLLPAAFAGILNDQALSTTVVVLAGLVPGITYWLPLNEILIVAPVSPVPEIVNPAVFSVTSTMSSIATVAIVGVGATVSSVSVSVAVAVLPASSVTVAVTVTVPSDNVDISTSGTTQSLPTFVAERTTAEVPPSASSIETDTEAASLSTPDSVMLMCDTSDAFVVSSAVANATAKLLSVSASVSTLTT